jgi:helix-turn-helix protein
MSKARVVVLEVVGGHLTVTQAARVYGLSRQHLYRLLNRYRQGGLEAVDPRSRRPASNPRAVSDEVIITVVTLRQQLVADGLDAGPVTLQWHLAQRGLPVPSTSTIRRILSHRPHYPATTQTPEKLLHPLPSRPTQPMLAIRLHPLDPGRRQRRRDPQLAR